MLRLCLGSLLLFLVAVSGYGQGLGGGIGGGGGGGGANWWQYPALGPVDFGGYILDGDFAGDGSGLTNLPGGTVSLIDSTGQETFYLASAQTAAARWDALLDAWADITDNSTLILYGGDYALVPGADTANPSYYGGIPAPLTLVGKSDVTIEGRGGPRLVSDAEGHYMILRDCTNITVRGLVMAQDIRHKVETGTYGAIALENATRNVLIADCIFTNMPNHGIITKHTTINHPNAQYVTIRDCYFADGGDETSWIGPGGPDGAAVADLGTGWKVLGNTFSNWVRGIEIFCNHHQDPVTGIVISGNKFIDTYNNDISIFDGQFDDQISDILIEGNIHQNSYLALNARSGSYITFANNIVSYTYRGVQIHSTHPVHHVTISGNQIRDGNERAIYINRTGQPLSNIVVRANAIHNTGAGIFVPDTGVIVDDNTLIDVGHFGGATKSGIEIVDQADSGLPTMLRRNFIANIVGTHTDIGIRFAPTSTHEVLAECNRMHNMVLGDYWNVTEFAQIIECDGDTITAGAFIGDGSGLTNLAIGTSIEAANRTLDAADCYNGVVYVSSAATLTLPVVASGMSVTFIADGAVVVTVAPNPVDLILLDGTALDDGDTIISGGTLGEIAVLTYYDASGWWATTDGWMDGGP